MKRWVLDASALLAYFFKENGSDIVALAIPNSVISSVNITEVIVKLIEKGNSPSKILVRLQNIFKYGLDVQPYTIEQATEAGLLHSVTKKLGLSIGDKACIALAASLNAPLLTADRAWTKLNQKRFRIIVIR